MLTALGRRGSRGALAALARAARGGEASKTLASSSTSTSSTLSLTTAAATAAPLLSSVRHFATNSHDVFNTHRESPENNKQTTFDFTEANYEKVAEILSHYPKNYAQSATIPLLDLAQQQNGGWLSLAAMNRVAAVLDVPPIRVYEVATFYTMFNRSKIGQYHVMVCGTTPCRLAGAERVMKAISERLGGIGYGQTSACGKFTLGEMECMGSCVNAPMIAVADYTNGVEGFSYNYFEDLTAQDAVAVVDALDKGQKPAKVGSQHRLVAEPAGSSSTGEWRAAEGPRTLTFEKSGGKPPGPYCRDLDAPEAQMTPPPPPPPPPPAAAAKK